MSGRKRSSETISSTVQRKRARISDAPEEKRQVPVPSVLRPEEVDFPRGGGTSFTPVEYKAIKAEVLKELNEEDVFKDSGMQRKREKRKRDEVGPSKKSKALQQTRNSSVIRVEHLNYKRITTGMKLLCQIAVVNPFSLIVSLPNQLLGHIPITHVSLQLTAALEAADAEDSEVETGSEDNEALPNTSPPDLTEMFHTGQYVRAVVCAVKPIGTTVGRTYGHSKDEMEKASRRVELSLIPEQVNAGIVKADLKKGFTMCAAVKSVEDHGYILDLGLSGISGFIPHKRGSGDHDENQKYVVGSLVNVVVDKLAEDGRTCILNAEGATFKSSILKEVQNVSSVLPGVMVPALITSISPSGLVVQVLGSFDGTIDLYHLPSGSSLSDFGVGKKVKARILYDMVGTSPRQFVLSLKEHILSLDIKRRKSEGGQTIQEHFPIGTTLQSVKVKRVEAERGLVVSVEDDLDGFVHISHTSDEHVPSLSASSGPWKLASDHRARVIGFHPLDGLLQLSFRPSVLAQKFLRVDDVKVGQIIKGSVKKLTDSALFVSINGSVDAMIWPNHYADIMLKHPQKRFKPGTSVKCRVLAVNPDRKRILLTAKKTLVESDLPIVSCLEDAEAGLVAHGVVSKVLEKSLILEYYNNIRAIVPSREVSETLATSPGESFPVGKPVQARILSVDREAMQIVASIRQASGDSKSNVGDIKNIEVGRTVSGAVSEVHRENVLLVLDPSRVRALISLHNIANHRGVPVSQLRSSLRNGDKMDELVVVSRNLDKGLVIVANRPSKGQSSKQAALNFDELSVGSKVVGRVSKHGRHGAIIKFPGWITGSLHPTDTCDDFEQGSAFPVVDTTVTATVIATDRTKKHLTLSTRQSRLDPSSKSEVIDREVNELKDLKIGEGIRGFIKSVAEHGVFVTIGRNIDARVQIKELYDEFVKDWKSGFKANQLVHGRILSIDPGKKQVEMSFRTGSVSAANPGISLGDLVEGQKIDGKVKKVEDFGIFISIDGSKLTGLCHKSEIADNNNADVTMALRNFREGDTVKAVVLSVDKEKRRISLGLKPSYFSKEDLESSDETEGSEKYEPGKGSPVPDMISSSIIENEDIEGASEDEEAEEAMVLGEPTSGPQGFLSLSSPEKALASMPVLTLQGFQWNSETRSANGDVVSSNDEESDDQSEKRRKKKRKTIEQDLTADMHTRMPESVADFERHLLASPNSSYMWIQYMSFQLQLSEFDKAREIGRRGLRAISIREEQERLNVWIALLNLENTYGTDLSLETLFKEAVRHNDSKTVHLRLAAIFDLSDKLERAEEQYKRSCKKFGQSSKVWTLFGEHYLRRGLVEESRKLLPRSLQSLEKRKHLKTISKFAQLEYKLGDPERGKTIFEGIIDSHSKRWDLWSVYIDMEAGQRDIQSVRNLFDRVLAHKMTSYKAKAFFKKWLELERRIGNEEGEHTVKEKTIEWTRRTVSSS